MSELQTLKKLEAVASEYRRREDLKKQRRTIVASGTVSDIREFRRYASRQGNTTLVVR